MFAICLEASHKKGMGHLFRMLNFANFLRQKGQKAIFCINDNQKTKDILSSNEYSYEIVNLINFLDDWESPLIKRYQIQYWINDRLNTVQEHANNIKKNRCKLITFDDLGSGAKYSDINICGLIFNNKDIKGKNILRGTDYLILNDEINLYKKQRYRLENILVTLGGSDTYGVTIKVLQLLKKYNMKATIHIGPSFVHKKELEEELTDDFKVINFMPSLIEEFSNYDLAITGGGITPFEANASGLPCVIIANEEFEISNSEYLQSIESSVFLGFHENIDESKFQSMNELNIKQMSRNGLSKLNTMAVKKIYKEII